MVEYGIGVLIGRAQAHRIGQLNAVLAAKCGDIVAAFAIGQAGLHVGLAERAEAFGLVVGAVDDELMIPEGIAEIAVDVTACIAIDAKAHGAVGRIGKRPGHDIDRAGNPLCAVEKTLATFQHLDPLNSMGGNGIDRCRRGVEAVVDAYTVDQP